MNNTPVPPLLPAEVNAQAIAMMGLFRYSQANYEARAWAKHLSTARSWSVGHIDRVGDNEAEPLADSPAALSDKLRQLLFGIGELVEPFSAYRQEQSDALRKAEFLRGVEVIEAAALTQR